MWYRPSAVLIGCGWTPPDPNRSAVEEEVTAIVGSPMLQAAEQRLEEFSPHFPSAPGPYDSRELAHRLPKYRVGRQSSPPPDGPVGSRVGGACGRDQLLVGLEEGGGAAAPSEPPPRPLACPTAEALPEFGIACQAAQGGRHASHIPGYNEDGGFLPPPWPRLPLRRPSPQPGDRKPSPPATRWAALHCSSSARTRRQR